MNSLDRYSDTKRAVGSPNKCECGKSKGLRARACQHCLYLDGVTERNARIICALRGTDGLSVAEICDALGIENQNQNGNLAMRRTLRLLVKQGRIRQFWRESDGAVCGRRNSGHWVFALDGRP